MQLNPWRCSGQLPIPSASRGLAGCETGLGRLSSPQGWTGTPFVAFLVAWEELGRWEASEAGAGEGEHVLESEPESCQDGNGEWLGLMSVLIWGTALNGAVPGFLVCFDLVFLGFFGLVCFSARKHSVCTGLLGKHCFCSCSIYCNS